MEIVLSALILAGLAGLFVDLGTDDAAAKNSVANDTDDGNDTGESPAHVGFNILEFGDGDDTITGTEGDDCILGGAGEDVVIGSDGNDEVFLGDGHDTYTGDGEGNDLVRGGSDDDAIRAFFGSNTLFGDLGADLLSSLDAKDADAAPDTLYGGEGDDDLTFDHGDQIYGGGGDDNYTIHFNGDGPPATIADYQACEDITVHVPAVFDDSPVWMELSESGEDTTISFGDQTAVILKGVTDPSVVCLHVASDELPEGGEDSRLLLSGTDGDVLIGHSDTDIAIAGGGDDAVFGGGGGDLLYGGAGGDYIDGGAGDDTITGGLGTDMLRGGAGDDAISDHAGQTIVRAGSGDDVVDLRDAIATNPVGADQAYLGSGDDEILTDDGDRVKLGAGADLAIISVEDVTDSPVTIKDFDPAEDRMEIRIDAADGVLEVTPRGDGSSTSVTVDGQEVAILNAIVLQNTAGITVVQGQPEEFR